MAKTTKKITLGMTIQIKLVSKHMIFKTKICEIQIFRKFLRIFKSL